MPREEGDVVREYQATHEDNFLSGWLRNDTEGKAEDVEEIRKRTKEKKEWKEGEKWKGWRWFGNVLAVVPVPVSVEGFVRGLR